VLSLSSFGGLGGAAETLQAGGPIVVEERAELRHLVTVRSIEAARAVTPLDHEPGLA
jgi:hypothetical protein